jgi:hypothetical protein
MSMNLRRTLFLTVAVLTGCPSKPASGPPYQSKICTPRPFDSSRLCQSRSPTPDDRVTAYFLNGPDMTADPSRAGTCMGLVLETEFASKINCRQRLGTYDSIEMRGGEAVLVDKEPACLHLTKEALEVRRGKALVARLPREPGMDSARSFPAPCLD